MTVSDDSQDWTDIFYCSQDALRLHARHYAARAPRNAAGRPALCLPGLTRNAKDFHVLATHLAKEAPRRRDVYCLDYRGRGRSAHDPDWRNYTPYIELLDVLDFMTTAGLHDAAVIGTSRGGIIAMLMAVIRPTAIALSILNDIGPVLEIGGLVRIAGYVGKTPTPATWDDATMLAKSMNQAFFPAVAEGDWAEIARQWFTDQKGRPVQDYDAKLGKTFSNIDLTRAAPEMWAQFTALSHAPTLLVRGEKSDLLSARTAAEMANRHPRLQSFVVEGQGHAPLLRDATSIETIADFIATQDAEPH